MSVRYGHEYIETAGNCAAVRISAVFSHVMGIFFNIIKFLDPWVWRVLVSIILEQLLDLFTA